MSKDKQYLRIKTEGQCDCCKYGKTYAISEGDYNCDKDCEDFMLLPWRDGGEVCPYYEPDPTLPLN